MGSFFEGDALTSTDTRTEATTLPEWMQNALVEQMGMSQAFAYTPYQAYTADAAANQLETAANRVAGPNANLQASWDQTATNVGAYQPTVNQAITGTSALASAAGGANAASPYFQNQGAMLDGLDYGAASGTIQQAQGQYTNPYLANQALQMGQSALGQAGQMDAMGAASPYMQQQGSLLGALDYDAATRTAQQAQSQYTNPEIAQRALQQGQQYFDQAGQMDAMGAANPYLSAGTDYTDQSATERAIAAADPYMQQAAQTSASTVDQYMNPYNRNVTDEIARLGARNLSESLLPSVSDAFIKAGSFGGTRMGEFGERAVRDTQESILGQQAQALQAGYGQSLQASQADLARQAQLAGTAGNIAGNDLSRILSAGGQMGDFGQTAGNLTNAQMSNLANLGQSQSAVGATQQNIGLSAARDVAAQQQAALGQQLQAASQYGNMSQTAGNLTNAQMSNLANLGQTQSNIGAAQQNIGLNAATALAGQQQAALGQQQTTAGQYGQMGTAAGNLTNADLTRQQSALQQVANLGKTGQTMNATDVAGLNAAGGQQQAYEQNLLNTAYSQFEDQRDYPSQQLDWLRTQLTGTSPFQTNTTTETNTGGAYAPSGLQTAIGAYGLYNSIFNKSQG